VKPLQNLKQAKQETQVSIVVKWNLRI